MRKTLPDISHNMRVKVYPDGTRIATVLETPMYRESGWESSTEPHLFEREKVREGGDSDNIERSKRRARAKIFDIAMSNVFTHFVTLTLDGLKVNRYDMNEIVKKLNIWLDNRVRRNGLRYILVPELHKDGAIHFHGFFNDALKIVPSGTYTKDGCKPRKPRSGRQRAEWESSGWQQVYNLPTWNYGFSTSIQLYGERRAAIGYICKYVTKAQEKIGGRWYYSGGDLLLPNIELYDIDFSDALEFEGARRYHISSLGIDAVTFEM